MRKPFSSVAIGLILLSTVVLPPLWFLAFSSSSMHPGVLLVSGLYVFLFVALRSVSRQSPSLGSGIILIVAVLFVVMTQSAIRFLITYEFDFARFSKSYALLILVLLGCSSFALLARRVPNFQVAIAVKLVFCVLLLASVAKSLHFTPSLPGDIGKFAFFFGEPSHFALSFLPFLLYVTVTARPRMKLPLLVLGYAIAVLLQSVTLIVGIALVTAIVLPLRRFLLLVPIAALTILLNLNPDTLYYFSSRVNLFNSSENLSALVFVSGWERAFLIFQETVGIGVGFQQFGIIGGRSETIELIRTLAGQDVSLLDGGLVASKFLGEFGFLGVTLLLAYLVNFAKNARWLHKASMSEVAPRDYRRVFFLSCFVMYFIDLFVRGTGYFSPSGFLFVASLIWLAERKRTDEAPNRDGLYVENAILADRVDVGKSRSGAPSRR